MNYKDFNLGDWIGHISGVIEDESELDGNEMRDLVEFLTKLKPSNEWIPVKDRLPNDDCECWITLEYIKTGNRVLYESHYDLELGFYNQNYLKKQGYKLIAWQKKRMPSPYKGE